MIQLKKRMSEKILQVVIPAYRSEFLEELLESLRKQTRPDFSVIVADDQSPDDVAGIAKKFEPDLDLRYVRFERNLGRQDLAGHWNRSIGLSSAPWLVMSGDDDLFAEDAVEAFYRELLATDGGFDVYRFPLRKINKNSIVTYQESLLLGSIPSYEYLKSHGSAYPVQLVFSKQAFERCGGFVSFNLGWHSDDASLACFSSRTGIRAIPESHVCWRTSDNNISAFNRRTEEAKFDASLQFCHWLRTNASQMGFSDQQAHELIRELAWRLYTNRGTEFWQDIGFVRWLRRSIKCSKSLTQLEGTNALRHFARFVRPQVETGMKRLGSLGVKVAP